MPRCRRVSGRDPGASRRVSLKLEHRGQMPHHHGRDPGASRRASLKE